MIVADATPTRSWERPNLPHNNPLLTFCDRKVPEGRSGWLRASAGRWRKIWSIALAVTLVALLAAGCGGGQEWYEGGTLHDASVNEWLGANERNRLATAADWTHIAYRGDERLELLRQVGPASVELYLNVTFRPAAESFMDCVDGLADDPDTLRSLHLDADAERGALALSVVCVEIASRTHPPGEGVNWQPPR